MAETDLEADQEVAHGVGYSVAVSRHCQGQVNLAQQFWPGVEALIGDSERIRVGGDLFHEYLRGSDDADADANAGVYCDEVLRTFGCYGAAGFRLVQEDRDANADAALCPAGPK